jgi:hypothetical protein
VGHHERADGAQDEAGVQVHRDEARADDDAAKQRPADHRQHDRVEQVDGREQSDVDRRRQDQPEAERRDEPAYQELDRADGDEHEAPEDQQVVLAGHVLRAFLGHLLLPEEVDQHRSQTVAELVQARPGICGAASGGPDHRVDGAAEGGDGQRQEDAKDHGSHMRSPLIPQRRNASRQPRARAALAREHRRLACGVTHFDPVQTNLRNHLRINLRGCARCFHNRAEATLSPGVSYRKDTD